MDGYGRFTQRTVEFVPALQIVLGPNEQGKSTLRSFVADMLYGQKSSAAKKAYDDSNELRRPWTSPDTYGGRLVYVLDDGSEIEVFRRFDRKNECVNVYDRKHAREITAEFEQLKNHEPLFALSHLGLSKEVFLNAATISHFTLEDLGDANALGHIQEKLLALADTGSEDNSTDATLKRLKARIEAIGQPNARSHPLPMARVRLTELNREFEQAGVLREELASIEERRRALLDENAAHLRRKAEAEALLKDLERFERAERLEKAERLASAMNEATQQCFALGAARDFPADQTPEVLRMSTVLTTARAQHDRTRKARELLAMQIASESEKLGEAGTRDTEGIAETCDQQLDEAANRVQRLRDRIDGVELAREASESRLRAAEEEFASVPDFSRLADDPVTWINQLASSFRIAVRTRDDECQKRAQLREQIAVQRAELAEPSKTFEGCGDFMSDARDYEVQAKLREEQVAQVRGVVEHLQNAADDYSERIGGFGRLCVLTTALLIALLVVALTTGNRGVYVPAIPAGLAAAFFAGSVAYAHRQTRRAEKELEAHQARLHAMWADDESHRGKIDQMIVDAGCQTLRELEGKYDRYRQASAELEALESAGREQERRAAEAEQRAAQMFESFQETFARMGEVLTGESGLDEAAGAAVARYQVYRDAKRRIAENKDQIRKHDAEAERLRAELEMALDEERTLALDVRRRMRENGYPEESKHDSAVMALRSYRIRSAELGRKRERIDVMKEQLRDIDRQIEAEAGEIQELSETLSRRFAAARVRDLDEWRERDEQAKRYLEIREDLARFQERQRDVLQQTDLNTLRLAVAADGPSPERPATSLDELKQELAAVNEAIEATSREEHRLHVTLAERASGMRPIGEIEEDRAECEAAIALLELELDAASHAMALIEAIARDKHASIAPKLAARASEYLKEITGGAYDEVLINRDLGVSVRIPQLQKMSEDPERILSKGTVDQIYLALRLAMIQCLSETGESIPMLLDDPFSNYDDQRLRQTLGLLTRLGQHNQILLFTCRDDVAHAARDLNAAVLVL